MRIGVLVGSWPTSAINTLTVNTQCTTTATFYPETAAEPFIPKSSKENCNTVTISFYMNNIVLNIYFIIL